MDYNAFILEQLATWWQFSVVALLIIGTFIIDKLDGDNVPNIRFDIPNGMPEMKPLPIPTKGKGFWGAVYVWIMETRKWELTKDFRYSIDGTKYVIPAGFVFDGASVPKFFRSWLSPMGVLLIGGLVHDYGYKYQTLLKLSKKTTVGEKDQKWMDETFRDINIAVNGFKTINYLAYYALRLGGFVAWRGHRKVDAQWKDSIN